MKVAAANPNSPRIEGAAIGVLFEARSELLTNELTKQQSQAVDRMKSRDATRQQIQIGTHSASFASTPDNSLRSFYVIDGAYRRGLGIPISPAARLLTFDHGT